MIFRNTVAVTAKLAGNTNTVTWVCNLPNNYAYRLDQVSLNVSNSASVDADNFEDLGVARINLTTSVGAIGMTIKSEGFTSEGTILGASQNYALVNPFGEVFQADGPGAAQVTFALFDNDGTNNTVELASLFYASFLQYDILQVTDVDVNAPRPVTVV